MPPHLLAIYVLSLALTQAQIFGRRPSGQYCMDFVLPSPSSGVSFQPYGRQASSGKLSIAVLDVYNFRRQGGVYINGRYRLHTRNELEITALNDALKLNDPHTFPYLLLGYTLKYNKADDGVELYNMQGKMQAHFSRITCPGLLSAGSRPAVDSQVYCSKQARLSVDGGGLVRFDLPPGGRKQEPMVSFVGPYREVGRKILLPIPFGRFAFTVERVNNATLKLIPDSIPEKAFLMRTPTTLEEKEACGDNF
ncbi:hypothetical protein Pmar_PMAR027338 [Perkinsus marinus ATCC 50983]|uniref:Uncharacterized protein n=1 Tax=Perkinsus marinus (strain ATCC 50983 / TXsc) TaxID=423536 RepID=C5M1Q4_PERM5|nr:hypothetical protein Pmar_PMAR027338 [Perkinsus marinus ATCC 50983]EEQ97092.1 hypothetical protein Pmar_PMAR027338 [Perkinsus marinus ATCC 50983]|eukprot:XP_002764375.1 hypothetical protein Pmar_PMAR027338 [Perkinsus marinus ATCC 50983]